MLRLGLIVWFGFIPVIAQENISETWSFPEARAFDDWLGEWNINNRTLTQSGTFEDTGKGYVKVYSVLDGKAILELWEGNVAENQIFGFSLRYYDQERGEWVALLNLPRENQPGFAKMFGSFRHGRAELYSDPNSTTARRGAISRYTFSDFSHSRLRWDGASTRDNGVNWRTTWIKEFSRAEETATWPTPGEPAHTAGTDARCNTDSARGLDGLAGRWEGEVERLIDGEWKTFPATMQAYKVLDGCGILARYSFHFPEAPLRVVALYSYFNQTKRWRSAGLDNRPGSGIIIQNGNIENGTLTLTEPKGREGRLRATWQEIGPTQLTAELSAEETEGKWMPRMKLKLQPAKD